MKCSANDFFENRNMWGNILIIHSHLYLDVCCKYLNSGWRQKMILLGLPPSHCSNSHCVRGLSWSWLHLWGTMMSSSLEIHYCSHFVRSFYSRNKHTQVLWTLFAGLQSWVLLILLFASALRKSYLNISTKVQNCLTALKRQDSYADTSLVIRLDQSWPRFYQTYSTFINFAAKKLCRHRTLKQ